ncbi:unnamed protein product [Cylicocyclus nassatus]|uniref:Sushi domain-containing protein n=1 Tax=Cylicocyclus nassatus TaxID=53992 RepID=A0AA36GL28_CYLNA|nr:unnamed protein product [Cylicocyclus nassatus]
MMKLFSQLTLILLIYDAPFGVSSQIPYGNADIKLGDEPNYLKKIPDLGNWGHFGSQDFPYGIDADVTPDNDIMLDRPNYSEEKILDLGNGGHFGEGSATTGASTTNAVPGPTQNEAELANTGGLNEGTSKSAPTPTTTKSRGPPTTTTTRKENRVTQGNGSTTGTSRKASITTTARAKNPEEWKLRQGNEDLSKRFLPFITTDAGFSEGDSSSSGTVQLQLFKVETSRKTSTIMPAKERDPRRTLSIETSDSLIPSGDSSKGHAGYSVKGTLRTTSTKITTREKRTGSLLPNRDGSVFILEDNSRSDAGLFTKGVSRKTSTEITIVRRGLKQNSTTKTTDSLVRGESLRSGTVPTKATGKERKPRNLSTETNDNLIPSGDSLKGDAGFSTEGASRTTSARITIKENGPGPYPFTTKNGSLPVSENSSSIDAGLFKKGTSRTTSARITVKENGLGPYPSTTKNGTLPVPENSSSIDSGLFKKEVKLSKAGTSQKTSTITITTAKGKKPEPVTKTNDSLIAPGDSLVDDAGFFKGTSRMTSTKITSKENRPGPFLPNMDGSVLVLEDSSSTDAGLFAKGRGVGDSLSSGTGLPTRGIFSWAISLEVKLFKAETSRKTSTTTTAKGKEPERKTPTKTNDDFTPPGDSPNSDASFSVKGTSRTTSARIISRGNQPGPRLPTAKDGSVFVQDSSSTDALYTKGTLRMTSTKITTQEKGAGALLYTTVNGSQVSPKYSSGTDAGSYSKGASGMTTTKSTTRASGPQQKPFDTKNGSLVVPEDSPSTNAGFVTEDANGSFGNTSFKASTKAKDTKVSHEAANDRTPRTIGSKQPGTTISGGNGYEKDGPASKDADSAEKHTSKHYLTEDQVSTKHIRASSKAPASNDNSGTSRVRSGTSSRQPNGGSPLNEGLGTKEDTTGFSVREFADSSPGTVANITGKNVDRNESAVNEDGTFSVFVTSITEGTHVSGSEEQSKQNMTRGQNNTSRNVSSFTDSSILVPSVTLGAGNSNQSEAYTTVDPRDEQLVFDERNDQNLGTTRSTPSSRRNDTLQSISPKAKHGGATLAPISTMEPQKLNITFSEFTDSTKSVNTLEAEYVHIPTIRHNGTDRNDSRQAVDMVEDYSSITTVIPEAESLKMRTSHSTRSRFDSTVSTEKRLTNYTHYTSTMVSNNVTTGTISVIKNLTKPTEKWNQTQWTTVQAGGISRPYNGSTGVEATDDKNITSVVNVTSAPKLWTSAFSDPTSANVSVQEKLNISSSKETDTSSSSTHVSALRTVSARETTSVSKILSSTTSKAVTDGRESMTNTLVTANKTAGNGTVVTQAVAFTTAEFGNASVYQNETNSGNGSATEGGTSTRMPNSAAPSTDATFIPQPTLNSSLSPGALTTVWGANSTAGKTTSAASDVMVKINETSESLPNGTVVIKQLYVYPNGTFVYKTIYDTAVTCPQIVVDTSNTISPLPDSPELSGRQAVGTTVIHMCAPSYVFAVTQQPLKIYECMANGHWTSNNNGEKCKYIQPRTKNIADL